MVNTKRWTWSTLFFSSDQWAQRHVDRGEYLEAVELFTDPMQQGAAAYRAGQFDQAVGAFGRTGTAEGLFNRGNALVLLGDYRAAIQSYEMVLQEQPDWSPVIENLALARARLERLQPPDDMPPQKGMGEDDEPDDIVFDDRAKNQETANEKTVSEGEALSDAALRAQWLRRVESSPAEFLKRKFAFQLAKDGEASLGSNAEGGGP